MTADAPDGGAKTIVVRGGRVVDGSGREPYDADVLLEDGRIEDIGDIGVVDGLELDASGALVAPGFIDIHSHSDYTLLVDPRAVSAIFQGVTLEVVGNCGHGCFPIRDPLLAENAVYGATASLPMDWHSAEGYFERLEKVRPAVNVMSLTPHGQLRVSAVGVRGTPLAQDERKMMTRELRETLESGSWGFSTGLEYAAEQAASEEDIATFCGVVEGYEGLYATHTRRRDEAAAEAVEEAVRAAEQSGVRLQVSHLVPRTGRPGMLQCVEVVDRARNRGVDVAFDMHTRLFGITYLHVVLPPSALAGGQETLEGSLNSRGTREAMKKHPNLLSSAGDWSKIVLLDNPVWPEFARMDIAAIAGQLGVSDPLDAVYQLLLGAIDDTKKLMVIIHSYSVDEQREIFQHPLCMPGSDATTLAPDGPLADSMFHGAYTWAAWFYRFTTQEESILTPGEAIRRLTSMPAARMGVRDRGILRPGACADVVIFDSDDYRPQGTTFEPNQLAQGMRHVLVNGKLTLRDGVLTGERAGHVLRAR